MVDSKATSTAVYLYLDIETIPMQDAALIAEIEAKFPMPVLDLDGIKADGRLKNPAKMLQGKLTDEEFAAAVVAAQFAVDQDIEIKRGNARRDYDAKLQLREQDIDAAYRKTSLDGTTGHIACIYHSFNDEPIAGTSNEALKHFRNCTMTFVAPGDPLGRKAGDGVRITPAHSLVITEERKMLERFFTAVDGMVKLYSDERWAAVEASGKGLYGGVYTHMADKVTIPPIVVAHHAAFDLRYIWQRAIILGVPVPSWWPHDAKAWDTTKVQDTMLMWAGVGQRIGLDRLCRALGIQGKGDIDGSKVWDAVREGRIAEVADYCGDDVERLRAVHRRIIGLPHIGYGFLIEDEINGGSSAHWDANPPTDPCAKDVFRTTEAEFDREELERAEYRAEAQWDYEQGEV